MNNLVKNLYKHGTVSFDVSERGYSIIFEPHFRNTLPAQMQSTVLIVRSCPVEAVAALDQYIRAKKHRSKYPFFFWTVLG